MPCLFCGRTDSEAHDDYAFADHLVFGEPLHSYIEEP